MKRKKLKNLNDKEKEQLVENIFNSKDENYNEYEVKDEDFQKKDGRVEILNEEIVNRIKVALEKNKEIRLNLDQNTLFIEK